MNKLPLFAQYALVCGGLILAGALAEKLIRSGDVSIAIANTRLEFRDRLESATETLTEAEKAALELKRQQDQYEKLKEQYDKLLATTNGEALKQLKPAIERIEPSTNLGEIAADLQTQREQLEKLQQ